MAEEKSSYGVMKLLSRTKWDLLLVACFLELLFFFKGEKPFLGYTWINVVADCQIGIFDSTLESSFTVVFEYPRMDTIRLFPYPVISP